jgi:hypothetical protein
MNHCKLQPEGRLRRLTLVVRGTSALPNPFFRPGLGLTLMLAIAAAGTRARAQDNDDNQPDELHDDGPRVIRRALVTDRQFDLFLFGRSESVEEAQSRIYRELRTQVRQLDRQYRLTPAQQEKLLLAGLGDIKRAFDRVEELRRKWQLVKFERASANECVRSARSLHDELEMVTVSIDSLFYKTIATTLTEEQAARADIFLREYQWGTFEGAVTDAAARLARVLNLNTREHLKLEGLMLSEIREPRRCGEATYAYIMYRLSRLPEEKIRPSLREPQWSFLHELLVPWHDAGQFLANDGFTLEKPPPI